MPINYACIMLEAYTYYASITLHALAYLLCIKLYRHNLDLDTLAYQVPAWQMNFNPNNELLKVPLPLA